MWMFLLTTICLLAVVIVGLLIMVQVVSLEQLGEGIWRGFLLIVLTLGGVWFIREAVLPILMCALVWLKHAMLWALTIILAAIASVLLLPIRVRSGDRFFTVGVKDNLDLLGHDERDEGIPHARLDRRGSTANAGTREGEWTHSAAEGLQSLHLRCFDKRLHAASVDDDKRILGGVLQSNWSRAYFLFQRVRRSTLKACEKNHAGL
jgi:hypothetical protein